MSYLLTTLTRKKEVDTIIRDTIDKVLVLRFGRADDAVCLQLDDILAKTAREVSKFATVALVDVDSEDVQVYVKYFDITLIPSTIFFFNAHHMKMDSGTADHTKWVGAFHEKQDFIDVVEEEWDMVEALVTQCCVLVQHGHAFSQEEKKIKTLLKQWWLAGEGEEKDLPCHAANLLTSTLQAIFRGAMKGKLIVDCPLPPERIPKYQLLYKDV
ncbi:thioredoxin-like protein 4B [Gossypium australe]|uniref:Thioredoxin-like protein 4B n=1 Tax=Gossypium australe TaxID=47621 RepID=A0A5B6VF04_9ROSI|nr:thioredoxin-like protein 4B [Gossypium australe]